MIPKIIHYVWLGGSPKPEKVEMCIRSWKKYMPDYEIKCWDESNVDLDGYKFLRDAYDAKKFGFTVDPLRLHILKQEGGIYLDSDVEAIKSLDEFLHHEAFAGLETPGMVNPGSILAATKACKFLDDMIKVYENIKFNKDDVSKNEPSPIVLSRYLRPLGLTDKNELQTIGELTIYPAEYFCPYSLITNKLKKTKKTCLIHHFAATWTTSKMRFKKNVKTILNFLTFGLFGKVLHARKKKNKARSKENET